MWWSSFDFWKSDTRPYTSRPSWQSRCQWNGGVWIQAAPEEEDHHTAAAANSESESWGRAGSGPAASPWLALLFTLKAANIVTGNWSAINVAVAFDGVFKQEAQPDKELISASCSALLHCDVSDCKRLFTHLLFRLSVVPDYLLNVSPVKVCLYIYLKNSEENPVVN